MWELDCEESQAPKNWCFWTVVLEKTLESPLDCKEIQPIHPKGNQSWILIGRTDAEAETLKLWPPGGKTWLIWKDPNVGEDWSREEKGVTEDEMVGWHHWLNGHGFGWTLEVSDGQGGLPCYNSQGRKELGHDWVTKLNWISPRVWEISETVWVKRDRFQMLYLLTQISHSIQFQVASWPIGVRSITRLSFDVLSIKPELQKV